MTKTMAVSMSRRRVWVVLMLTAASAVPLSAQARPAVDRLSWLGGCWASVGGEAGSGEQWMAPAGGTLLGMSRTVEGGRTVTHEFLEIKETSPGKLAYVAHPSGQAETAFPLARIGVGEVVFENPEHDFPQRILYRLDGEGMLRARIEGLQEGKIEGIDLPMRRVECGSR